MTQMTYDEAREFLEKNYPKEWKECDALPQRVNLAVFVAPPSLLRPAVVTCG